MKKIKLIIIIFIIALVIPTYSYAKVGAHASHSIHTTSHSTSGKTTISGAKTSTKTYTTPKSFTSKYNTSNIKTNKVQESSHYSSYNSSNIFRPNFWTAMWAFQCMHDNTEEVTEQDIAKELEERGYTQEEIQEILKEGEQAKEEAQKQEDEENKLFTYIGIGIAVSLVILVIVFIILEIKY